MLENPEFRTFVRKTLGYAFNEELAKRWDPPQEEWMFGVYTKLEKAYRKFLTHSPEEKSEPLSPSPPAADPPLVAPVVVSVARRRRWIGGKWV